jgi:hypothetical protein
MSGFRIEHSPIGEGRRSVIELVFGDDPALSDLPTHYLTNRVEADRIYFQLPQAEPNNNFFAGHSIPYVVQNIPGIFAVESVNTVKFMRRQSEVPTIAQPEYCRNPSFVARLTPGSDRPHPLDLWYWINQVVDIAYTPDALLSKVQMEPGVDSLTLARRSTPF